MPQQKGFNYLRTSVILIFIMLDKSEGSPIRIIPKTEVVPRHKWFLNQQNLRNNYLTTMERKLKNDERFKLKSTLQPSVFEKKDLRKFDNDHLTPGITPPSDGLIRRLGFQLPAKDTNYYPNTGKLSTVCFGKSTIYNQPRVLRWLKTQVISNFRSYYIEQQGRKYFWELRKILYIQGRSEECHTRKMNSSRKYLECALKRHQRMEYMIPQYPLHQIYFHKYTTILLDNIYH
ncbi:uncharacterized protein LOC117565053 [Drosophila albomicans]|uniref:Uncharacterized protein LOC117565053 n=1 Tax=Drosophila albomicans TaxID=7291 RepID=A0A6P8XND4_DROAB|nr:uncharacterized protein LOC117565053 [Drosophila albomicans]